MKWDLREYRIVTASAYPGMMAPLTSHPSCVCVLSGNAGGDDLLAPVLSLEALDGVRRRWRFGDVSRLADFVPRVLAEAADDDRPILLVAPRESVRWQGAAAAWPGRVHVAASSIEVVAPIAEDKVHVRGELARLRIPVPDALIRPSADLDFGDVASALGVPFVLQTPNGAGGQGTYLIHDPHELAAALQAHQYDGAWLVSRFCGEITINVSGLVHHDGVTLLPASVQTSGVREVGVGFGAYCGSDFATDQVPATALMDAYRHTAVIGRWLRDLGHRGLYGADIAIAGDRLAFLEVNPRIQGSSWLLSALQQRDGAPACLVRHVEALLGAPADQQDLLWVRRGSHLIVRWDGPAGVVTAQPACLPSLRGPAQPAQPAQPAEPADPTVTVTAVPRIGVRVEPGAIVARLESTGSLCDAGGQEMLPATRAIVDGLLAGLRIASLTAAVPAV